MRPKFKADRPTIVVGSTLGLVRTVGLVRDPAVMVFTLGFRR